MENDAIAVPVPEWTVKVQLAVGVTDVLGFTTARFCTFIVKAACPLLDVSLFAVIGVMVVPPDTEQD